MGVRFPLIRGQLLALVDHPPEVEPLIERLQRLLQLQHRAFDDERVVLIDVHARGLERREQRAGLAQHEIGRHMRQPRQKLGQGFGAAFGRAGEQSHYSASPRAWRAGRESNLSPWLGTPAFKSLGTHSCSMYRSTIPGSMRKNQDRALWKIAATGSHPRPQGKPTVSTASRDSDQIRLAERAPTPAVMRARRRTG